VGKPAKFVRRLTDHEKEEIFLTSQAYSLYGQVSKPSFDFVFHIVAGLLSLYLATNDASINKTPGPRGMDLRVERRRSIQGSHQEWTATRLPEEEMDLKEARQERERRE